MRPANSNLILNACRAAATEIRAAAMQQGLELDDEDRRGLFALAAIIERKTDIRAQAHDIIDRAVSGMIDLLDALDAPAEDLEPSLGAPERHTSIWGRGVDRSVEFDQRFWAGGGDTDEREVDDADLEHCGDDEPTLGAPERHPMSDIDMDGRKIRSRRQCDQTLWACGSTEDEHEAANEDGDDLDAGELDEFPRRPFGERAPSRQAPAGA